MMTKHVRRYLGMVMVLVVTRASLTISSSSADRVHHPRTTRQLHRILDPFGLLGKAGEAVQGAVEGIGKTLDQGAQHVGKMMEDGAASIDAVFKDHIDQVQAGLEEAGKVATIVGEDLVDSVSSFVASNHLQEEDQYLGQGQGQRQQEKDGDELMRREGIVDGFLRMVGINPSQVGLMALNVLIFLAELITTSLIGETGNEVPETRSGETSVLSWFLGGGAPFRVDAMLREAQDPGLPRAIIEKLVRATGDDTACVQLLVCKMSPLVWGLQRSVKTSAQARAIDPDAPEPGIFQTLYASLPELDDFVNFSESCERQFPACPLLSLADLGL